LETKGNYVLVGLFALVVMAASFAYFYWSGRYNDAADQAPIELRVVGSAAGLGPGSAVLFNGIRAGSVTGIAADPDNPRLVRVYARIDQFLPIKEDTRASIGAAGITGVSSVNLNGGSLASPRLLQSDTRNAADIPVLSADASADIFSQAQELTGQAGNILTGLESLIQENRSDLNKIIDNAVGFTTALDSNSAELESFLRSASDVGRSLEGLAGTLAPSTERLEQILAAVEPEKVASITANAEAFSANAAKLSETTAQQIDGILADAATTVESLSEFADALASSGEDVQALVASVEIEQVETLVNEVVSAAENIAAVTNELRPVAEAIGQNAEDIDSLINNVGTVIDNVRDGTKDLAKLTEGVTAASNSVASLGDTLNDSADGLTTNLTDTLLAVEGLAIDTRDVVRAIDAEAIQETTSAIRDAAKSAEETVRSFEPLGETVSASAEDIESIVKDLRATMDNIRGASAKVGGLIDSADTLIGSDQTQGLIAEATLAARSFRELSDVLAVRSGQLTADVGQFTNRGLKDLQELIRSAQTAVQSFDRLARTLQADPQRVIFGGSDVKEFDGRQRR
jgi:phospholipid/cholesterol/gamma-HCH transport system substrate-binding protein